MKTTKPINPQTALYIQAAENYSIVIQLVDFSPKFKSYTSMAKSVKI